MRDEESWSRVPLVDGSANAATDRPILTAPDLDCRTLASAALSSSDRQLSRTGPTLRGQGDSGHHLAERDLRDGPPARDCVWLDGAPDAYIPPSRSIVGSGCHK